ncbi:MAG: nitrate reductase subunit beta [Candidatus Hydrogenedentes bacterium]|nr:nitrate reductase subunit beta [Candidatus Hydrogenedentota bacterium]
MDVRAHVSMVFHLDKCIGCHTCSVACKNVWTDRPGAEYMWWNNVETKPGTGYPTRWEDQMNYKGGWELNKNRELVLRSQSKGGALAKLFYNPRQPGLDDYYEPWTYRYQDLFDAPSGDDQPTAVPISQITGEPMDIEAGPNWDDDLSGSPIYAENDPNLDRLTEDERQMLFDVESIAMMYLPRICNHCANPSCVASCPSGALYKRGEDGIVLVNQEKCRGWRACVVACPYKKMYYNWQTGKSEKCILCYPRVETGQPPACFHSCVGRIRYMGVLLYDAERMVDAMKAPEASLVEAQRNVLLDPHDREVAAAAEANGISPKFIAAAQQSPVYKYVKEWQLALPLHPEFRTLPMLYYVPPLLPVMGRAGDGIYEHEAEEFFTHLDKSRLPMKFLASLFSAGNLDVVKAVMKKQMAVRYYKRAQDVDDVDAAKVQRVLREAHLTPEQAEAIYALTALAPMTERYVMPPIQREEALDGFDMPSCSPEMCKGKCGLGMTQAPQRGA